jgi:uncharacterized protein (DUF2267 family)
MLDRWPELPKLDHEGQRIALLYEKQSYEFSKVVLESLATWLWRQSTKKFLAHLPKCATLNALFSTKPNTVRKV